MRRRDTKRNILYYFLVSMHFHPLRNLLPQIVEGVDRDALAAHREGQSLALHLALDLLQLLRLLLLRGRQHRHLAAAHPATPDRRQLLRRHEARGTGNDQPEHKYLRAEPNVL